MIEPKLAALVAARARRRLGGVLVVSSRRRCATCARRRRGRGSACSAIEDPRPDGLALATELGAELLIPGRRWVDARVVEAAHVRGLDVWVWTVNEPGEMRRLIALGVDAIFSDYPERFAGLTRPS